MVIKRMVFWEPCISPHKHDLLSSLAMQQSCVEVLLCAQSGIPHERIKQGWEPILSSNYETIVEPSGEVIKELVAGKLDSTVHIFSGIRHFEIITKALALAINNKATYFIMSEPRVFENITGFLRLFQSWIFEIKVRKTTKGVFAIGANGPHWFKLAGYSESKIIDFAYYLSASDKHISQCTSDRINVAYVGALIAQKGVKYLIEAVLNIKNYTSLNVIGAGPDETKLKEIVGKETCVSFVGTIPNSLISFELTKSDILVLPSINKDGWGAVVSEALFQGCFVIVTKKVGASAVVIDQRIGCVVDGKSSESIEKAIISARKHGLLTSEMRSFRAKFARDTLTGEAGAKYIWDVIQNKVNNEPRVYGFLKHEST